ncbi:GNAT family N-acetyltransferase [Clostridium manihotivorum]|uniref:N-acetyltransferase n=1 Tax=Clostridium manihotivorum TaxID=2320868 RepID=A0A3R5U5H0_9CLOT|nr:GNAT family N-acetyltransferase [Clostridium manihotivorum]QAA32189.1 N-acetyltransferase [Clostridium manihotivorum]
MNLNNIITDRLILIPVTLEITQSLLEGSIKEIEKLGIGLDEKWPTNDTKDILPFINKDLEKSKIPSGFEFWMIVKKDSMKVVGDIGFKGKPDEKGEIEVGFGLVENERGKGFGFEALRAITDWAFSQKNVKVIKADCLIDNRPSARILEKVGMKEINRDQDLIYWELRDMGTELMSPVELM